MMMPLTALVTIGLLCCPLAWPYLLWINWDKTGEHGGKRWKPARDLFICELSLVVKQYRADFVEGDYFRDYFPVHIEAEAELECVAQQSSDQ